MYHVIPKVIFPLKICCITPVCNFSAHLLLWVRNSKSHLFFEMQTANKIKCQNTVYSPLIKTQRENVIYEEIMAIATVIVMKRIQENLDRERK